MTNSKLPLNALVIFAGNPLLAPSRNQPFATT